MILSDFKQLRQTTMPFPICYTASTSIVTTGFPVNVDVRFKPKNRRGDGICVVLSHKPLSMLQKYKVSRETVTVYRLYVNETEGFSDV